MKKIPEILKASNKGTSVIFFSVSLSVIAVFAALAVDIGVLASEKAKLSHSVDAAALAGVQELISNTGYTESVVNNYINKNISSVSQVDISIDSTVNSLEVTGHKTVQSYFAKIIGINSKDITASATAKFENITSLKGVRPLAVIQQNFVYGKVYTLKEGAGDGSSGNYAAIALGGTGESVYRDNLEIGYSGTISVGDLIQTETGNIAGTTQTSINQLLGNCTHSPTCTFDNYNRNCSRIIFIPVVNTLDVSGRKYVKVLGFGTFFLEGVSNHRGQADVIGRFITYSATGETSSEINDYGTYGIKLVK